MTEQKSTSNRQKDYANRGRSLSRQILGNDMDFINKYQSKYSSSAHSGDLKRTQTYTSVPVCYFIFQPYPSTHINTYTYI